MAALRGKKIQSAILALLRKSPRPLSTREISKQINVTWHPVIRHCSALQLQGKIDYHVIGHSNIWFLRGKKYEIKK